MHAWSDGIRWILDGLLTGFRSPTEQITVAVVAVFVTVLALTLGGRLSGATMATGGRAAAVVVTAILLLGGTVIATHLYLMPHLRATSLAPWVPHVVGGVVLLLLVVPLAGRFLVCRYFETVFALVFAVFIGAAVIFVARYGLDAFRTGDQGFMKTRRHRDGVNAVIDDSAR